jgi:hypothetical protein
MRLDEREIPGASEKVEDAPDLLEVRISKRGRIPKRQWPEVEATKPREPRKKRTMTALPTPTSTQNSTQTTIKIHEDEILPESSQLRDHAEKKPKENIIGKPSTIG